MKLNSFVYISVLLVKLNIASVWITYLIATVRKEINTFSVFKSLASHFCFRLRKSKLKKMDRNGGASSSSLSYPSPRNGIGPSPRGSNGYSQDSIIKPEMCYYCFDVLYCHLYQLDPPRVPMFTNSSQ